MLAIKALSALLVTGFCIFDSIIVVQANVPNLVNSKEELSISSGSFHTCALERRQGVEIGGALRCWGQGPGQTSPPPGIFRQVSSGDLFSCALTIDNAIKCWGNIDGPDNRKGFSQVSSGKNHACAVKNNGLVECWGRGHYGETKAPHHLYSQVSCGDSNTCGLRLNGSVDCWGKHYSDAGDGRLVELPTSKFIQISVGMKNSRACGVTVKGDITCWGSVDVSKHSPIHDASSYQVRREGPFLQVSCGNKSICGLKSDRTAECWGQMRSPIPMNSTIGGDESKQYKQISLGLDHACALDLNDNIQCWHRGPDLGAHVVPLGLTPQTE